MNRRAIEVLLAPDDGLGNGPSLDGFADDDADITEIVTLKPGEKPPEDDEDKGNEDDGKVTLSKEEYEALRSGKDSTGVLAEGLKELKDALGQQSAPANMQQQPGESDEDFEKRLEQELFAEGNSAKAIKEAVQRYGGMGQLMGYISQQNKRLLELDSDSGPIFKRYKGEIEKFVSALPPEQQTHPQVWDYAFKQVKDRHQDELQQETVEQMVERRVQERLSELGVGEGRAEGEAGGVKNGKGQAAGYMETGRGSANKGAGSGGRKRKVYVTDADKEAAERSGVPIEHYLRKIGKL